MNLEQIGLKHFISKTKLSSQTTNVARIFSEHKTGWDMITSNGPIKGILMNTKRKEMSETQLPKVGDWVVYQKLTGENKAKITEVLPRYSSLVRHLEKKQADQTIATNIDVMLVVLSVDQIFNPLQLNRYLTIALTGKIEPVVVINKIDKQQGEQAIKKEILSIHPKVKIVSTSATLKNGLKKLDEVILSGRTAVLVGNSGTGKSSLVNALLSESKQSTKAVSEYGKGQHTTTSRKMFILPNGGIIIDTPGMRTLELNTEKQSNTSIFTELLEISRKCKYRNCDHIKSAGCALQQALSTKTISQKQFDQFLNLSSKHVSKISYNKSRN